jgi:hypothetical protein
VTAPAVTSIIAGSMRLKLNWTWFSLALVLLASPAVAAPGLAKGTVILSGERLFGLTFNRTTTETATGDRSVDHTGFGLFLSQPTTVHMQPRVALDVLVADGFTLGGSFGFFVGDRETSTTTGGNTMMDDLRPVTTAVVLAPRAGFAVGLGHVVSLWLRAGITYFNSGDEQRVMVGGNSITVANRTSGLAFDIEPTLLFSPFPHFAFTAGLVADVPLTGTQKTETTVGNTTTTTSRDRTIRNFGVVAGLLGMF